MASLDNRKRQNIGTLLRKIPIKVSEVIFPQGNDADLEEVYHVVILILAFRKQAFPDLAGTELYFVAL